MKLTFTDGNGTKSVNPWAVDQNPEAWTWYTGQARGTEDVYYAKVAAMYRAHNLKANTISSIPFVLLDKSGNEYDTSRHWENKVGFMPNPQELFRLNVLSYMMTNTIYNLRTTDRLGYKTRGLYHAAPYTFTPVLNGQQTDVQYIERTIGTGTEKYKYPKDPRLVWMWRLDHNTELLPSQNTESQAIASAAEIIFHADYWVGNFFRRGGIKPTLIGMKGMLDSTTKEEQEKSWSNWLKGVGKWGKNIARIFNAESIDPRTIGAGVDDMKDNNVYRQAIENIAMGTGMPLSLLLANSANMATAKEEKATWFDSDIIPFVNWMAYEYNKQVFEPLGLFLEYRPETMDVQQEDETQRAQAYATYVNAGMKPSIAAQMLGLELPDGVEYDDLNEAKEEKEAEQKQPDTPAPKEDEPTDMEEPEEDPIKWTPSLDELEDLRVWREVALRRNKKGEGMDFEYLPHHGGLPDHVTSAIKAGLLVATDAESIKAVFDVNNHFLRYAFPAKSADMSKVNEGAAILTAVKHYPAVLPYLRGRARFVAIAFTTEIKTEEQFDARLSHLVTALYNGTINAPSFVDSLAALISRQITLAFREAWTDEGEGEFPQYLTDAAEAFIVGQYDYVDQYAKDIFNAGADNAPIDGVLARVPLWSNRYNEAYNQAMVLIQKENGGNLEWVYGDTEHCDTCISLNGIVMSAKDWDTLGVKPQSAPNDKLICGGWRCQCELTPTDKRRSPGAFGRVEEILLAR